MISTSVSVQIFQSIIAFGTIKFFLSHTFLEKSNILAFIDWYGDYMQHMESGMMTAMTNSAVKHNPFVYVSQIQYQLVIAPDETEPNKIWI